VTAGRAVAVGSPEIFNEEENDDANQ
jgi:hypothetical protein